MPIEVKKDFPENKEKKEITMEEVNQTFKHRVDAIKHLKKTDFGFFDRVDGRKNSLFAYNVGDNGLLQYSTTGRYKTNEKYGKVLTTNYSLKKEGDKFLLKITVNDFNNNKLTEIKKDEMELKTPKAIMKVLDSFAKRIVELNDFQKLEKQKEIQEKNKKLQDMNTLSQNNIQEQVDSDLDKELQSA